LYFRILNSLFKQQFMASDKKFVLQWLPGVGDLWPFVFNEIFHPGRGTDLYAQNTGKHLTRDVGEPRGDFMGVDQKHQGLGL
jgi:hypothetical protein